MVITPTGAVGTVDVTVTTAGGISATSSADQFTYYVPAPTVTALSSTTGPTAGGTTVTITGTNLTGATAVTFGDVAAAIQSDTATKIVVVSPAGVAGTADVTVTTAGGTSATSSADQFTYYIPAPAVTVLSPTTGSTAGGTTVTITGTNRTAPGGGIRHALATIQSDTATQIVVMSPAGVAGTAESDGNHGWWHFRHLASRSVYLLRSGPHAYGHQSDKRGHRRRHDGHHHRHVSGRPHGGDVR